MSDSPQTRLAEELAAGRLIPYLGPETLGLDGPPVVPNSNQSLAAFLAAHSPVPGRIRGNVWAAAQYIESKRHRLTLARLMDTAFATPQPPNRLHRFLAKLAPPLIVDTWYDDALVAAFAGRSDWGQIQAATRNGKNTDIWFHALDSEGTEVPPAMAAQWSTILYKPHGAVRPHPEFLLSDSDYVEVLTEIDIQTPIPPVVQERRTECGFLFLGCRFSEQMDRIFARQIMKRSAGPHTAILSVEPTRNEARFLEEMGIARLDVPLTKVVDGLLTLVAA